MLHHSFLVWVVCGVGERESLEVWIVPAIAPLFLPGLLYTSRISFTCVSHIYCRLCEYGFR